MIDLHTHSLLSDGALLPSELARRAKVKGYTAIAITDHIDGSNIDFVVPRLAKICSYLSKVWKITVIPGAELTHVPLENLDSLVSQARQLGAKIVLVHGETIAEPVIPGTNKKALESDIDILTHPGLITLEEAKFAAKKNIYLEITTRKGHCLTNGHVAKTALKAKAKLVLNTDSHAPEDLVSVEVARKILEGCGLEKKEIAAVFKNSEELVKKILTA